MNPESPASKERPNWWGRNWKWFVPTVAVVVVLLPAICCGGMLTLVFGMLRQSEPYQQAYDHVQRDPKVIEALGEPIESSWLVTGNIHYTASRGVAELSFGVSGPQGAGHVFAEGTRHGGPWQWQHLRVVIDGTNDEINVDGSLP